MTTQFLLRVAGSAPRALYQNLTRSGSGNLLITLTWRP